MNWLMNNIQILIFLLIIGSSVFGWVMKQLREQAELKRIENERHRRKREELRTGQVQDEPGAVPVLTRTPARVAPAQPTAAGRTRLEEIALKRQAQIAELRRRRAEQLARAKQSSQGRTASPPTQRQAPQQAQRQTQAQTRAQAPRQTSRQTQQPIPIQRQAQQPSRRRRAAPAAKQTLEQRMLTRPEADEHLASRFGAHTVPGRAPRPKATGIRAALVGGRLREAIVLAEIISPPVSMRNDHLSAG